MVPPTAEEIASLVGVHISHIHDDHFDKTSLRLIPKNVPILIARYTKPVLRDAIKALGFENIIEMEPWTKDFSIGPFHLTVFPKAPEGFTFDSSIVLRAEGRNFYVANDCIHFDAVYTLISHMFGAIEGAFIGYAAINPRTWCTDYSELETMTNPLSIFETTRGKQDQVWDHLVRCVRFLKPKWVHPYASDYRFLNRDLVHHNDTFYEADEIFGLDLGETKPVILNAGDVLSGLTDKKIGDPGNFRSINISEIDLKPSWLESNCNEPNFAQTYETSRRFFLDMIRKQSSSWKKPMTIEVKLLNKAEEKSLVFHFDGAHLIDQSEMYYGLKADLTLEYPSAVLAEMFSGRWTLRAVHSLFMFKARWRRLVYGQTDVLSFNA